LVIGLLTEQATSLDSELVEVSHYVALLLMFTPIFMRNMETTETKEILWDCYAELDNGVTPGVPVDALTERVLRKNIDPDTYFKALTSGVRNGEFAMLSPGVIALLVGEHAPSSRYLSALS